jgi:hypothetical protein
VLQAPRYGADSGQRQGSDCADKNWLHHDIVAAPVENYCGNPVFQALPEALG